MADSFTKPTRKNFQDLTGRKFGRLQVISFSQQKDYGSLWLCRCDCGNEKVIFMGNLRKGVTISCGCYQKECMRKKQMKHNLSQSAEYKTWAGLKARCKYDKKGNVRYYGKGIKVCERWLANFENFLDDMGKKPSPNHSIDRINSDGDYEPSNCRWATPKEQANNRSNNFTVEWKGEKYSITNFCEMMDVEYHMTYDRLKAGWGLDKALSRPKRKEPATLLV